MNIGSLFVKIGLKGGKESVAVMDQLKNATLKTKLAALGAVVAFAKMSQEARKLAMNLEVFETATGISGDALQKMSFRAAAAGVSLDNYGDTLQRIQQMTMDIARGEGNIAPFAINSIGISKDPIKVLDQIQARLKQFHATDPARAAQLAQDFGLSNEMMYALLQGQTEEIQEQWLLKSKDKEALVTLNKEWYKLWWYVKQIGIRLQGFLAHIAIPIVKSATQILKMVGEITIGVGEWIQKTEWVKYLLGLITAAVLALLVYLFPIYASVIMIALAVEDIYGYFNGKDSIIGGMIEWIEKGELLKSIFLTIGEIIRNIVKFLFGPKAAKALDIIHQKASEYTPEVVKNSAESGLRKTFSMMTNPLGATFDMFKSAKPALATAGRGNWNLVQHNIANFISSGDPVKDGEAAGAYNKTSAEVSDATFQSAEASRGGGRQ